MQASGTFLENAISPSGLFQSPTYAISEEVGGIPFSEIKHAVEIVCYQLLNKFRFGSHEIEDMKQEAYILAIEVLRTEKYDKSRSLNTFLYVHIHNRLYNFKRKCWARLTPPCASCSIGGWIASPPCPPAKNEAVFLTESGIEPGGYKGESPLGSKEKSPFATPIPWGGYCTKFNDLMECPLYNRWIHRNNAKKNLAGNSEDNYRQETPNHTPTLDNVEYLDWIESQLPMEHLIIWRAYRQGKRVNRQALAVTILWVQNNVLLTYE